MTFVREANSPRIARCPGPSTASDATARSPASRPRSRGPLVYRHASSRYSTVHLAFDIFQGIGVAAAVGIRPFLPALAAGALAAGDVEIHFNHTDFSFLQSAPFLLAMAVVCDRARAARAAARRRGGSSAARWADRCSAVVAGARRAVLRRLAVPRSLRDLARDRRRDRVRARRHRGVRARCWRAPAARLAGEAALLPVFAEGSALLLAALSVLAPPVGPDRLLALLWLLWSSRRREGQKYAGLRILQSSGSASRRCSCADALGPQCARTRRTDPER